MIKHCLLSVDAFLSSTVRRYGGCARDTFWYAGFLNLRSANLRTAATLHRIAAISGSSTWIKELHNDQTHPKSPHAAIYRGRWNQH
ncbi:hypothetical protein EUX53_12035 [Pseudomonas orientalis]|nr:hypothetical protein EUX53_12035 [Pseudomonas orientalis]